MKQQLQDISSCFADIGIILPLVLAMALAANMDTGLILIGMGMFAIVTGLVYKRPIPVQPMKVVAALTIVGTLNPQTIVATGIVLGLIVLVLGLTGWIEKLKQYISDAVMLGIQTALALTLILTAVPMIKNSVLSALGLLVVFLLLKRTRFHPAAFIAIFFTSIALYWDPATSLENAPLLQLAIPAIIMPDWQHFLDALNTAVFPQFALTITNALLLTASLAHEYYPDDRERITEKRLAVTTGSMNILLTPLGAIPMCHGAGGVAAYHAAGGRTGLPVIVLGSLFLLIGLLTGPSASWYLSLMPEPVFGLLLLITASYMVDPKKLMKVSLVSGLTIVIIVKLAVFYSMIVGLLAGLLFEYLAGYINRKRQASHN